MKIIHIISGGDTGGAKTHLLTLLKELNKECECQLLCIMEGKFTEESVSLGIKTKVIKQKSRFDLKTIKKIGEYIKASDFDIVPLPWCKG